MNSSGSAVPGNPGNTNWTCRQRSRRMFRRGRPPQLGRIGNCSLPAPRNNTAYSRSCQVPLGTNTNSTNGCMAIDHFCSIFGEVQSASPMPIVQGLEGGIIGPEYSPPPGQSLVLPIHNPLQARVPNTKEGTWKFGQLF